MTRCPDCHSILRKELRPKLIDSGRHTLRKKCPICNKRFPSDQEEIDYQKARQNAKDQSDFITKWWERLRGKPHVPPQHEQEIEETTDNSWW